MYGYRDNRTAAAEILVIGRAPLCYKYYLKATGGRTIIFGFSELKKSSGSDRQIAGQRPGDVFWIGRLSF
jgi:hypothetical protein